MKNEILIELDDGHLDLLAWFAAWTPGVHWADAEHRRAWPPGFRELEDLSVSWRGSDEWKEAHKALAVPPDTKRDGGRVRTLLEWRMVEGVRSCARLTPRGRAALRLAGRDCVDRFASHCPEVFDDVPLTPVVLHNEWEAGGKTAEKAGDPLPDEEASWRRMLVEYHEADYQGRHTLTRAGASLTRFSSNGTWLNGSVRQHHSGLLLEVRSETRQPVLRAEMSLEGFTDLLTSNSQVPITINFYVGDDGMPRSEPAPPPVSPTRRMRERLQKSEHRQDELIAGLEAKVRALMEGKKLSKKAAEDLLHDLRIVRDNGDSNRAFVVDQAVDEMSVAVESLLTITGERVRLAGGESAAAQLTAGTTALLTAAPAIECRACGARGDALDEDCLHPDRGGRHELYVEVP